MTRCHAAITRSVRDLTAGQLTTTMIARPAGTLAGFRVATTTLLTRQLDQSPNGYALVKRRVALGLTGPTWIGVPSPSPTATPGGRDLRSRP